MLETLDLSLALEPKVYKKLVVRYQSALNRLAHQVYTQQRPVILVFEGWNAAGKGGAIRLVTERIDPRGFVVHRMDAPSGEDASHHYLWRYWRRLPEAGQTAIFDHSWYRRVLVERVEENCTPEEWGRAYREINSFERQQLDFGTILFKFWIHIDQDEQLRRFEALSSDPIRSWKLTEQDWRDRGKWDDYAMAVEEMLLKTHTTGAPWTLVEGNSKPYARVKILRTVVERLSRELDVNPFPPTRFKKKQSKGKSKSKKAR